MLTPTNLQVRPPGEHVAEQSTLAVLILLLVIAVVVPLSVGTIRRARPGRRLVVLRRDRVHRTPKGRTAAVNPLRDRVVEQPTGLVELGLQTRARTADGAEVRVLAEVTLDLSPPVRGRQYLDPLGHATSELSLIIEEIVAARELQDLLDPRRGLRPALQGIPLEVGARVCTVDIAEVEVLLGDRRESSR